MTTQNNRQQTRDEVLFAFHEAFKRPTAAQILEWTTRYPEFADDLRDHAAIARDWAAREDGPVIEPGETMLARGHSRVLNAIHNAEATAAAAKTPAEPCLSFKDMMGAKAMTVPQLAREVGIPRCVLADLLNGGMRAPVGKKLVNALCPALGVLPPAIFSAQRQALDAPRLGHAKADGTPTIKARTYEEVIRTSGMTPEQVEYWLSEEE